MKHLFTLIAICIVATAWSNGDPVSSYDPLEVSFYEGKITPDYTLQQQLRNTPAWQNFVAQYGFWGVEFNENNLKPHRAWGSPIPVDGIDATAKAQNFLASLEGFNIPVGELVVSSTPSSKKNDYVNFRQYYNGLEVINSRAVVKLNEGRVIMFGADVYHDIEVSITPSFGEASAATFAEADMTNMINSTVVSPEMVVMAIPAGMKMEYHLAYKVVVNTSNVNNVPANYETYVDAHNGEILYRTNLVKHISSCPKCKKDDKDGKKVLTMGMVDIGAHFSAEGTPINPYEGVGQMNMGYLNMTINGQDVTADAEGNISTSIDGPSTASMSLSGSWSTVYTDGVTPSWSLTLMDGDQDIDLTGEAENREFSAYQNVNVVHDHMKTWLPDFTGLDWSMTTNVNVEGECNAFYDGSSVNFFDIGGGCNPTSLIADVVYHEYGHGINGWWYADQGANFNNGAMGEGYSDFWAISITDNPHLGQGFYTTNEDGIRRYDIDPKVYPQDLVGQVHADGEIIMGAWYDTHLLAGSDWDWTTQLFVDAYAGLQATEFNGNEGVAYRDVLLDALQEDDDDGDLLNGTPNGIAIVEGFAIHGITLLASANLDHSDLTETLADEVIEIDVSVLVNFPFSQYMESANLYWRTNIDTEWTQTDLINTDGPLYQAEIPAQEASTIVHYYLGLEDIFGNLTNVEPVAANLEDPNLSHKIIVGMQIVATHDSDTAEDFGAWQTGVVGDNATTGQWELNIPIGSFGTPGDFSTVVAPYYENTGGEFGEFCFLTGQSPSPDGGIGENDVDGGHTTLRSQNIDLTDYEEPVFSYYRWYVNAPPSGANPGTDWWYVQVSDDGGSNWVFVEETRTQDISWRRNAFRVSDYIDITDEFRIQMIASDSTFEGQNLDGGSLIEAAVDDIHLWEIGVAPGVEEVEDLAELNVYPNPVEDVLNMNLNLVEASLVRVELINTLGQVVYSDQLAGRLVGEQRIEINVSQFDAGMYTLTVRLDEALLTEKVTIK